MIRSKTLEPEIDDAEDIGFKEARLNKNINDAFLEANKKRIEVYNDKIYDLERKVDDLEAENEEMKQYYEEQFQKKQAKFKEELAKKEEMYKKLLDIKIREGINKQKVVELQVNTLTDKLEERRVAINENIK